MGKGNGGAWNEVRGLGRALDPLRVEQADLLLRIHRLAGQLAVARQWELQQESTLVHARAALSALAAGAVLSARHMSVLRRFAPGAEEAPDWQATAAYAVDCLEHMLAESRAQSQQRGQELAGLRQRHAASIWQSIPGSRR